MKKAMSVLALLLLLALPRMVEAQEPSDNGTVPYSLWLPVVEMHWCPYRVSEMWYTPRLSGSQPSPEAHYFGLHVSDVSIPERNLVGRMSVALDANMQNVLYSLRMGQYFTALSAQLEQNELNIGQTYYWQAQIVCENGAPGPKSTVQEFIATCAECDNRNSLRQRRE